MHEIGARHVVKGAWDTAPAPAGRLEILLNPGMYVFGFGSHVSTRMFVEAVERLVRPRDVVVDVGTGTGILGIAAARLGAAEVHCTDLNDEALALARANVASNGLDATVRVVKGTLPEGVPPVDLVVANIDRFDVILEIMKGSLPLLKASGLLAILPNVEDLAVVDQVVGVLPYTETATREERGFTMKILVKD